MNPPFALSNTSLDKMMSADDRIQEVWPQIDQSITNHLLIVDFRVAQVMHAKVERVIERDARLSTFSARTGISINRERG